MWSTCHKHGTKKKSESPTGIDLPYTGRISDALTTELQRTRGELGHIQIRVIYMYMTGSPRVHRSSVVRVSERCTEGLRFNPLGDADFFFVRCSWHVDHNASHFFTELKINHLSLLITTIVMPPVLRNSSIACKFEFESCIFFSEGVRGGGGQLESCFFVSFSSSHALSCWHHGKDTKSTSALHEREEGRDRLLTLYSSTVQFLQVSPHA